MKCIPVSQVWYLSKKEGAILTPKGFNAIIFIEQGESLPSLWFVFYNTFKGIKKIPLVLKRWFKESVKIVKRVYCSWRGPEFGCQHPYQAAHSTCQ